MKKTNNGWGASCLRVLTYRNCCCINICRRFYCALLWKAVTKYSSVWDEAGVILSTKLFLIEISGKWLWMLKLSSAIVFHVCFFYRNWNIKQMKLQTQSNRCVNTLPSHLFVHMNLFCLAAADSFSAALPLFSLFFGFSFFSVAFLLFFWENGIELRHSVGSTGFIINLCGFAVYFFFKSVVHTFAHMHTFDNFFSTWN